MSTSSIVRRSASVSSTRSLSWLVSFFLFGQGCGGKPPDNNWLPTYRTTGRVTVNGAPASGAIVRLYPASPAGFGETPVIPTGTVREDGTFELTSYRTDDGAPAGDYRVTLEWPDATLSVSKSVLPEDPPDRLKRRFSDPARSNLPAHVAAGENHLEPIVLEKVELHAESSLKSPL